MTVKRVSPQEADALVKEGGHAYLDVRSIPEFDAGHPAGAYNIPLLHATPSGMRPNPDFLSVVAAAFAKDAKLVLGCRTGIRSLRAAQGLLDAGLRDGRRPARGVPRRARPVRPGPRGGLAGCGPRRGDRCRARPRLRSPTRARTPLVPSGPLLAEHRGPKDAGKPHQRRVRVEIRHLSADGGSGLVVDEPKGLRPHSKRPA